jgi:hypothetical protein
MTVTILYWPERPDAWITVRGTNVDPPALRQYAEGLRAGSVAVAVPFTFEVVPQGMVLDQVAPSVMVFRAPGVPAGGSFEGKFAVFYNTDVSGDPADWPLRVGGRPASVIEQDGGRSLQVNLGQGRNLVFQVPPNVVISEADLNRIAAGTRVTAGASPGHG